MDNTSGVDAGDGFGLWHLVTCRNFSLSECQSDSTQGFRARISSRAFGPLGLSAASSGGIGTIRMTRGREQIRKDPRDHLMLYLVLSGRVDIEQNGRQASALTGDMFLYDQTMPFSMDFYNNNRSILVNVPRALLESRVQGASRFTARRIAGDSELGALSRTVIRQIVDLGASPRADTEARLTNAMLDIISTTLDGELGAAAPADVAPHRLLPQMQRYMLAHLHDPGLDVEAIARAQNVSPRTLSRIFAAEGTTPMRWLWRQRLAAGHRLLSDGSVSNVTEAAFSVGFSDVSHFGRAFKREFGRLPQTLRRARLPR